MSEYHSVYPGETVQRTTRATKEGRDLTYVLRVIQQPERARACGSGAKASADRRPVDPPPVVELRIFEGCFDNDTEIDVSKDITFSYNANFFLFATLEHFRPMAHGRVQSANNPAVLTGMPVSGMAYLDRPSAAGYFIFPDLSVRHEGKYVLSFNLYEETKEAKDEDATEKQQNKPPMASGSTIVPTSSFDWRMEVKSKEFTVFSAKKFPGLAESTSLSRAVAEQGCRVRIRRDVRMRRRGEKGNDGHYEEEERTYSRRTATPDVHNPYDRQRSLSNSSASGRIPYDQARRPSEAEYQSQYQNNGYARSPAAPQVPNKTYLDFGSSSNQQYQTPQYAPPQQPAAPTQSQSQYPPTQQSASYPPVPYRQPAAPSSYSYERPQYSYSTNTTPRRETFDEYSRPAQPPSAIAASAPQYPPMETSYGHGHGHRGSGSFPSTQYPRPQTPVRHETLAPLKNILEPQVDKVDGMSTLPALPRTRTLAPSLPSPGFAPERSQGLPAILPAPEANRNGKRSFDAVFHQPYGPLHNGTRPSSAHYGAPSPATEDEDCRPLELMVYKRADGTDTSRRFPL